MNHGRTALNEFRHAVFSFHLANSAPDYFARAYAFGGQYFEHLFLTALSVKKQVQLADERLRPDGLLDKGEKRVALGTGDQIDLALNHPQMGVNRQQISVERLVVERHLVSLSP